MEIVTAEVFILTAEPRTYGPKSAIALYGSSNLGTVEILCEFNPYFYASTATPPPPQLGARNSSKLELYTALSGEQVYKLQFSSIPSADSAKHLLQNCGITTFESDVRPRERFLMDLGLNGGLKVEGPAEKSRGILRFKNPRILPTRVKPDFRICSLDIETSISTGAILSIGIHLTGQASEERRVFMLGPDALDAQFELTTLPSERELLSAFLAWFQKADPDLVIGWNVIGFDLSFLKSRAEKLNLGLLLGRDFRPFTINESSGRFSRANLPGRIVLDGPQLLRTSFYSFESYSLENISQSVLGEGKLIGPGGDKPREIERLFRDDKKSLAEYNLKDAELVTQIFEKLGLIELTIRRTELSGMLLDQVGMSTASLDHFYLPRLHSAGYVAPNIGNVGEVSSSAGGYVMSPVAGIYDDIIGLDFRSLYPTVIQTFGIDPLARALAGPDPLVTPGGFKFSRTHSILPGFIGTLIAARGAAKSANDKPLSQAIKILMNSFYGVMGSSGSRLYHSDLPDAITSTGQWLLVESKRFLEEQGHRVIYGDTDSLFVQLSPRNSSELNNLNDYGRELALSLNIWWRDRIKLEFGVQSFLQLDFKKNYKKFLVPAARGGEGGAKKRYAGLVVQGDKEEVEFVGLEVVRSDWTKLARDFQTELYTRIFRGEPVDEWIREFVGTVRAGGFDEKMVYRKRLHKPIGEYGSSPPPYVRAAQLMAKPSREVRYVMTTKGPMPVELEPRNIDYTHYIERQLRPVADSIFEVLGTSFDEILSNQLRLL